MMMSEGIGLHKVVHEGLKQVYVGFDCFVMVAMVKRLVSERLLIR